MKYCSKCRANKADVEFNKTKNNNRGLTSWCKSCIKSYDMSKNYAPIYVGTKICQTCKVEIPATEFYVNKRCKDGLEQRCKACSKLRKENNNYRRKYGITLKDYELMAKNQNNTCAICNRSHPGTRIKRFHVDHNHITGIVRGLLCENCNRALGQFQDNPVFLKAAIIYLEGNNDNNN